MPARVCSQPESSKALFRQRIREKVQRDKAARLARMDEELPSWAAWALKPIVGLSGSLVNMRDNLVGKLGEATSSTSLHMVLPSACVLINDVVLEPGYEDFIQLDHVVVGPSGVHLIETKAWEGAFLCHGDDWKRRDGKRWTRCPSPTKQSVRHVRLLQAWLNEHAAGLPPGVAIRPLILFTRSSWLKTNNSPVPVYESSLKMGWHIRKDSGQQVLSQEDINRIVEAIVRAEPFDGYPAEGKPSSLN